MEMETTGDESTARIEAVCLGSGEHMEHEKQAEHTVKMDSSEMGLLWGSYQNDTMSICMAKHFLQHVDDEKIRYLINHSMELAHGHLQSIKQFMSEENFPIPKGFSDADVNLKAPRLFSDAFYVSYLHGMAMMGIVAYSAGSSTATRADIRQFYNKSLNESLDLRNKTLDVLLEAGLHARAPYISTPDNVDFVDNRSYLNGFFGKKRPLNVVEITNLYLNIQRNTLGKALVMGFAQVAQSPKVRQFMERGKDISHKHVKLFSEYLLQADLPVLMSHDDHVMNSTEQTFSDKLMMFHVTALITAGVGNYGIAMGSCPRRDLGVTFTRLQAEVAFYGEDGAEIMIDNGWLEEPPQADDRKELIRQH
jgi:hypothetical protein